MNSYDMSTLSWSIDGGSSYTDIKNYQKINSNIFQVVFTKDQWTNKLKVRMVLKSNNPQAAAQTIVSDILTVLPDLNWNSPKATGDTIYAYPAFATNQPKTSITLGSSDPIYLSEIKQIKIGFCDSQWVLDDKVKYLDAYWDYTNGGIILFYVTWEDLGFTNVNQYIEKYLLIQVTSDNVNNIQSNYFSSAKIKIMSKIPVTTKPTPSI